MISTSLADDPIRKKIEALGTSLSLPTVRKALGVLEGEHSSSRRGGSDDIMDIRAYEPGDESRFIDWKTSARIGRPMVVQHARLATSHVWMLLDVGYQMTGSCANGEQAWQVATNALRMFAALSLRRSDDISLVMGDEHSITRVPFNGGFAQFEHTLDRALEREWNHSRNIDALLDYARRIRDRDALIVLATDEIALQERHVKALGALAATHPIVLITVSTANPFSSSSVIFDGLSGRRVPAFLIGTRTAEDVDVHRSYITTAIEHELSRHSSRMIRAASSETMFNAFVRLVSLALARSTHNQLRTPPMPALTATGSDATGSANANAATRSNTTRSNTTTSDTTSRNTQSSNMQTGDDVS